MKKIFFSSMLIFLSFIYGQTCLDFGLHKAEYIGNDFTIYKNGFSTDVTFITNISKNIVINGGFTYEHFIEENTDCHNSDYLNIIGGFGYVIDITNRFQLRNVFDLGTVLAFDGMFFGPLLRVSSDLS